MVNIDNTNKPITTKFDKTTPESGINWELKKVKDASNTIAKGFPKFQWDKKTLMMSSYDDVDFITVGGIFLSIWETGPEAGFTKFITGFTDELSVAREGFMMKGIKEGFVGGNKKDVVAANETAYGEYTAAWTQMLWELAIGGFIRGMMGNLTYSDTARSGTYGPYVFTKNSWDNIIGTLVERSQVLPIPQAAYDFVNLLLMYIQRTQPYTQGSLEIPGSFFLPWTNHLTYAQLFSDTTSLYTRLQENVGKARQYMEKFNERSVNFTPELVMGMPRKVTRDDPDWIALMNHYPVIVTGSSDFLCTVTGRMYSNMTTDYTTRKYFFRDDKDNSWIHRFAGALAAYSATNNLIGINWGATPTANIFSYVDPTTADYYSLSNCSYLGTAFTVMEYDVDFNIIMEIPSMFTGDATNIYTTLTCGGGTGSPQKLTEANHPLFLQPNIVYGDGVTFASLRTMLDGLFIGLFKGYVKPAGGSGGNRRSNKRS